MLICRQDNYLIWFSDEQMTSGLIKYYKLQMKTMLSDKQATTVIKDAHFIYYLRKNLSLSLGTFKCTVKISNFLEEIEHFVL